MEWWKKIANVSPLVPIFFFYGRFYLPLPYKRQVITVLGKPINIRQLIKRSHDTVYPIDPTQDEMKLVYETFKEELQRVYNTYKPSWEDRPLVIMDAPPLDDSKDKSKITEDCNSSSGSVPK